MSYQLAPLVEAISMLLVVDAWPAAGFTTGTRSLHPCRLEEVGEFVRNGTERFGRTVVAAALHVLWFARS